MNPYRSYVQIFVPRGTAKKQVRYFSYSEGTGKFTSPPYTNESHAWGAARDADRHLATGPHSLATVEWSYGEIVEVFPAKCVVNFPLSQTAHLVDGKKPEEEGDGVKAAQ